VLGYPDVGDAVEWLCETFGFRVRWQAGNHRAQLAVGDGAVAVTEGAPSGDLGHSIMVRVADADAHYERARQRGATILQLPADFPYGERQYSIEDPGGHVWTFSQSIADVAPEEWGGTSVQLD
jgi:uncharacterized glyoxalase superfamily protein PhnB